MPSDFFAFGIVYKYQETTMTTTTTTTLLLLLQRIIDRLTGFGSAVSASAWSFSYRQINQLIQQKSQRFPSC